MRNFFTCMRRLGRLGGGVAILLSGCELEPAGPLDAGTPQAPAPSSEMKALLPQVPLARVISRDDQGQPRFFMGSTFTQPRLPSAMDGEQAARLQLVRHARVLGLSDQAVQQTQ